MTDLRSTIPLDPPAAARTEPSPAPTAVDVGVRLGEASVERILDGAGGERFEVRGTLGVGATSQVLAVYDRDLDREVAIKVLRDADPGREDVREFLSEARTTAGLSHPNVLPVHDLHLSADGRPCFSMGRIEGTSLGDAIAASTSRQLDQRIRSPNAVVTIFIAVCHAMRYAHSRGIVHQDLKPDNILLGDFGEVLVLDWGSAARVGADGRITSRLYGTPLYMSPEQARRSHAERRSDVYALGATLFHALTLRPPMWSDDQQVFWERKLDGAIDPLTPDELRAVPAPLASIALAAMRTDPDQRYASAEAMALDLERYQAGLAVSVHRDPLIVVLRRWYAANRRLCWGLAAAAVAVAAMVALLLHEKAKERSRWTVVVDERFDSPPGEAWRGVARNWSASRPEEIPTDDPVRFPPTDGAVSMRAPNGYVNLAHRDPVLGDLRVEWDARATNAGVNFNAFLHGDDRESGYTFHVGAHADPRLVMLTRGPHTTLESLRLEQPMEAGRTYRLMVEKEGHALRLAIDGVTRLEYHDLDIEVPATGTFGFDTVEGDPLVIDNVRVLHKPLAQRLTAIAHARSLMQLRLYPQAYAQFADILGSYGDGELAPDALLGMATCSARLGRNSRALMQLDDFERRFPGHPLVPYALRERLTAIPTGEEGDAARDAITARLAPWRDHAIARSAALTLSETLVARCCTIREVARIGDPPLPVDAVDRIRTAAPRLRAWLAHLGQRIDQTDFARRSLETLLLLGRPEVALELYTDVPGLRAHALEAMGRFEEVLSEPYAPRHLRARSLFALGRLDEAAAGDHPSEIRREALVALHGVAGALERWPEDNDLIALAGDVEKALARAADPIERTHRLIALRRYDEALALAQPDWQRHDILLRMGRYDEALAGIGTDLHVSETAALVMLEHGHHQRARDLLERTRAWRPMLWHPGSPFTRLVLPMLLANRAGERVDPAADLRVVIAEHRWLDRQRPWHLAARLLGEIDDADFLAQPYRLDVEQRLRFAHGILHELAGRWAEAEACYRECTAGTRHHSSFGHDAASYLRWRTKELAAAAQRRP